MLPAAVGRVQNGTGRIEPDQHGDQEEQRRQKEQSRRREEDVEESLHVD